MSYIKGLITVIVAVYKAEEYLERCLKSILSQTYNNLEIILVDDGSPDRSGKICDSYSKKDSRVKTFHQHNMGVSGARENGLLHSHGEYIIHIDPDDWIDMNMIKILYSKACTGNYDVVVCDFCMEHKNGNAIAYSFPNNTIDKDNLLENILLGKYSISNCNKLIRKDLFDNYNIHFPIGFNRWEDYYINCLVFSHNPKVCYIREPLYHVDRYSNDNSISRDVSLEELKCLKHYINLFKEEMPPSVFLKLDYAKLMVKNCAFFRLRNYLNKRQFDSIFPEIRIKFVKSHLSFHFHELSAAIAGIGFYKLGKFIYSIKRRPRRRTW